MHARLSRVALSSSSFIHSSSTRLSLLPAARGPCAAKQLRSLTMSAKVLSSSENLPVGGTAAAAQQGAANSMEPPTKQPRLEQPASFKVKLLNEHAQPPKRGSALAAGYDLFRWEAATADRVDQIFKRTAVAAPVVQS